MGFENGNVFRVTLRATRGEDEQINTLHYDGENGVPLPDVNSGQDLADRIRDDLQALWAARFQPDWTIQPIEVVDEIDPQDLQRERQAWQAGSAIPGTQSAGTDLLPRAVCLQAKLATERLGRRFNGRMFLAGTYTEAQQAAGLWLAAVVTAADTFFDAIPRVPDVAPPLSTSTCTWSVYSRTQRVQDRDPYLVPISSVLIRDQVRWLRSRQA